MFSSRIICGLSRAGFQRYASSRILQLSTVGQKPSQRGFSNGQVEDRKEDLKFAHEARTVEDDSQIFIDEDTVSEMKLKGDKGTQLYKDSIHSLRTVIAVLDQKADRQKALDLDVLRQSIKCLYKFDTRMFSVRYLIGWMQLLRDCVAKNFSADEAVFDSQASEQLPIFLHIVQRLGSLCVKSNGLSRIFIDFKDIYFLQMLAIRLFKFMDPKQMSAVVSNLRLLYVLADVRHPWQFFSPMFTSRVIDNFRERQEDIELFPSKYNEDEIIDLHQACIRVGSILLRVRTSLDESQFEIFKTSISRVLEAHANLDKFGAKGRTSVIESTTESEERAVKDTSVVDHEFRSESQDEDGIALKSSDNQQKSEVVEGDYDIFSKESEDRKDFKFRTFVHSHNALVDLMTSLRPYKDSTAKDFCWSNWFAGARHLLNYHAQTQKEQPSIPEQTDDLHSILRYAVYQRDMHSEVLRLCCSVLFAYLQTRDQALFDSLKHVWSKALQISVPRSFTRDAVRAFNEIEAAEYMLCKIPSLGLAGSIKLIDDRLREKLVEKRNIFRQRVAGSYDTSFEVERDSPRNRDRSFAPRRSFDLSRGFRPFSVDDEDVVEPSFDVRRSSRAVDDDRTYGRARRQRFDDADKWSMKGQQGQRSRSPFAPPDSSPNFADRRPERSAAGGGDYSQRSRSPFASDRSLNFADRRPERFAGDVDEYGRGGGDFGDDDVIVDDRRRQKSRNGRSGGNRGAKLFDDADELEEDEFKSRPSSAFRSQGYGKSRDRDFPERRADPKSWDAVDTTNFDSQDADDFGSLPRQNRRAGRRSRVKSAGSDDDDFL